MQLVEIRKTEKSIVFLRFDKTEVVQTLHCLNLKTMQGRNGKIVLLITSIFNKELLIRNSTLRSQKI